jgi:drug/metabolite transporter superfamily protein YnfA
MSLGTILLIVLVLALLGVIPTWPHSKGWGYAPSGGVGLLVVILVVLLVTGNI